MMTNQDAEVNIFQNVPLLVRPNTVLFYLDVPLVSNHDHSLAMLVHFLVRSCIYWLCLSFTTLTIQYGIL